MRHGDVELHNVAELHETGEGVVLQRVPESVRRHLNESAREKMRQPASSEIRFETADESVAITLSADEPVEVIPFWGPFRGRERYTIGPGPRTIELRRHERLADLDPAVAAGFDISPDVWRVVLRDGPVRFHGVNGNVRPPAPEHLPDTRYLAYGTSITQGSGASNAPLTYANQTARRLGADPINLGSGGSAYCEPELADYIAGRDDWDVATLALSVNMVSHGFSIEEFSRRVSYMVDAVAAGNPDSPVVAITLFPFYPDLWTESATSTVEPDVPAFREALRGAVADAGHSNLHLLEGTDLLDPAGLTADLVHPADDGMIRVGERLADRLGALL